MTAGFMIARRTSTFVPGAATRTPMITHIAPALFVLIWSTGFVVARWAVPHAAPELILLARLALTALLMGGVALVTGQRWPRRHLLALHLLAGGLLNGVYLCTSWWAIGRGMPAGIMALLGALQPLVVAVGSFLLLGERLSARQWAGLGVGLGGVVLVLAPLLGHGFGQPIAPFVVLAATAAVIAMAAGTMIQRGPPARDGLWVSMALQNTGGTVVAAFATVAQGDYRWDNSLPLWLGLGWAVLMLSAAALSLLVWMTRRQGATRVSLLLLLVPPLAAIETRFLFGEHLSNIQLLGFLLALGGVLIARAGPRQTLLPDA
jgi:drug/metabolite transporter (DMT)-like permease